jgi:hypothetical protein
LLARPTGPLYSSQWRANFRLYRKTDDGCSPYLERSSCTPSRFDESRHSQLKQHAAHSECLLSSKKGLPSIHLLQNLLPTRVCETLTLLTNLPKETESHRPEGQIRNKLRRRLPSRPQTGDRLPNSSNLAPLFTLYALMLSTLQFNILQTAG